MSHEHILAEIVHLTFEHLGTTRRICDGKLYVPHNVNAKVFRLCEGCRRTMIEWGPGNQ